MNSIAQAPRQLYIFILIFLTTLISGISLLPPDAKEPHPDSAIFLYAGQQILNGSIMYKDLWDNKGPLLYYINALAVLISPASMWGLYMLELVLLFAAILLGYLVIEKALGWIPAIIASIIWPLALFYINNNGGNFTEEYSLPLSFAALYLYIRSRESGSYLIYTFFIGVIFALSVLLRPNNAGVEISIALVIFITGIVSRSYFRLLKEVIAYALGTLIIVAAVLLYFYWIGALGAFYDAFIEYNSAYSVVHLRDRIESLIFGLNLVSPSGLPVIVIVAWILGLADLFSKNEVPANQKALVSVAVIGLPVEFILSSMSGLTFNHYYLCWLPVFAVLTGYFIFVLLKYFPFSSIDIFNRRLGLSHILVVSFLIAMTSLAVLKIPGRLHRFVSTSVNENTALEAIKDGLDEEQYLLMWGASSYYNYVTQVKAPSRFYHQLPLFLCAYTTDEMVEEFLDDIKEKKPLIVDTSATDIYLPPFDKEERKKWKYMDFTERQDENCKMNPKMEEVFDYVYSNYELVNTTERYKWKIYRYNGNGKG